MLERDAVWALVGVGAACWAIGGGGPKWTRRYLWPSVLLIVAVLFRLGWWRALLGTGLVSGAAHLGYGDSSSSARRVLVFLSIGLSVAPFGVPVWCGLSMGAALWAFWFSSQRVNQFTWKWWELTAGALQGFAVASALLS